jgi:uncharacterized protein (TIGR02145 family)
MKKLFFIIGTIGFSFLCYSCKKENKPPNITEIQVNPTEIITNSVVFFTALAVDPEGDNLEYSWNCSTGTFKTTTGQSVEWAAPSSSGTVNINLTVSDGTNSVKDTKSINIRTSIGNLSVNSTPSGANILMDGVDTKKITPANFTDLETGIKIISVTKTGYLPYKDTISVNIQYKKTSIANFTLIPVANITGNVYYAGTKIPVSGVTISIYNKTFTTSSTGSYNITEIVSGNVVLSATKPDYDQYSKTITLNSGDNTVNIEMTSGIYTNTITGYVKTSIGTTISGVTVYLLNENNTNTNIYDQTDASGNYQLPAVPQGPRKIAFSRQGFVNDQKLIFVSNASRIFDEVLVANLISPADPVISLNIQGNNQIKWTSGYGPELMGFNIYRSSTPNGNYVKINSSLITLLTNPPINGVMFFDDHNYDIYSENYYKLYAVNTNSYEGPSSQYVMFPFISFKIQDIDLNYYNVVKIGTQIWMAENLKTTRLNNGQSITYLSLDTISSYFWYNNDINYKNSYGAHYNWYAVNTGMLCPISWHVPNETEWSTLITFIGGPGIAGGKLKETGIDHWIAPNIEATNSSSFTALPGGRSDHVYWHYYEGIGLEGYWWSSTYTYMWRSGSYWNKEGRYHHISNSSSLIDGSVLDLNWAISVRCVKNN